MEIKNLDRMRSVVRRWLNVRGDMVLRHSASRAGFSLGGPVASNGSMLVIKGELDREFFGILDPAAPIDVENFCTIISTPGLAEEVQNLLEFTDEEMGALRELAFAVNHAKHLFFRNMK